MESNIHKIWRGSEEEICLLRRVQHVGTLLPLLSFPISPCKLHLSLSLPISLPAWALRDKAVGGRRVSSSCCRTATVTMWKQPSPAVTCWWEPCRHLQSPVWLYSILWRAPALLSLLAADLPWSGALEPWSSQMTVRPRSWTSYPMRQHVMHTRERPALKLWFWRKKNILSGNAQNK